MTLERTRPVVGAYALGIGRAAYEYALDYAKERAPGIVFKDITPVLENPPAFRAAIGHLARRCEGLHADGILAIETTDLSTEKR